jgi:hypothetical protein
MLRYKGAHIVLLCYMHMQQSQTICTLLYYMNRSKILIVTEFIIAASTCSPIELIVARMPLWPKFLLFFT